MFPQPQTCIRCAFPIQVLLLILHYLCVYIYIYIYISMYPRPQPQTSSKCVFPIQVVRLNLMQVVRLIQVVTELPVSNSFQIQMFPIQVVRLIQVVTELPVSNTGSSVRSFVLDARYRSLGEEEGPAVPSSYYIYIYIYIIYTH